MSRRAIVAGATGLVGGLLVEQLCACPEYDEVVALARRQGSRTHKKLSWRIVDFAALPELTQADVFCALGTTIKRAGSKEAFWKVDHDFVVRLAKRAKQAGAPRFLLVSALGADEHSKLFYNQVKGTTERDVLGLGLAQVCIFRPSLLVGEREERRFGEGLASLALRAFEPLMRAGLSKYRPVAAAVVARAMLRVALDDGLAPGQHCFESDRIAELGAS